LSDSNTLPTIIIFIKNPELGKAKTRLASTVGPERALGIYIALLGHTRRVVSSVPARRLLYYSSFIDTQDEWSDKDFDKYLQIKGGLGEKMATAFQQAFENGAPVLIVGSDCAQLTPDILLSAIESLNKNDVVIGPAEDGGYYLLGMNRFLPELFRGISWSTEQVFPQTLTILEKLGASYGLLPTLSDIDYEEDWDKHGWEVNLE
jgi:rSAM/selenodomain-associated transferase 1